LDKPTSSRITRELLDWTPTRPGLIARLDRELDRAGAVSESA